MTIASRDTPISPRESLLRSDGHRWAVKWTDSSGRVQTPATDSFAVIIGDFVGEAAGGLRDWQMSSRVLRPPLILFGQ